MNQALVDAYTSQHPNVTIEIETRPGGTEGDNIVKTRLATGDMSDLFFYNSGSLLQALNPAQTLVDLSDQAFLENVVESFLPTVSQGEGVFGVPVGTAMGGGILYNKKVYADLGLSVPTTWEQFVANNVVIAEAGIAPVLASFGDSWSSQLFVLGDYYNVAQAEPDFAEKYTANQAKYVTSPAAMAGFSYLQQGFEFNWWQADYATARS
ncbi:MAG UNVERIFIED_CONTAM: extracellular solute-binding protein [Anaerolineae bacterium]